MAKGEVVPCTRYENECGSGGRAPLIRSIGMPRLLDSRGKRPHYPLNTRLRGTQNRSGHFAGEILAYVCRKSNHVSSELQPIA
jgi:hypothetical protein